MSIFNNSCPSCGYHFGWVKRVRSSRCLGFARKTVKCPGCGADLIWSRRSWRMLIGGLTVALLMLPVGILMGWDHSFEPTALCWAALTLAALFVSAVGIFKLHFEAAGAANQHLQATPR